MACEDAPCCGFCGTNIYGQYQGEVMSDAEIEQLQMDEWEERNYRDDLPEQHDDDPFENGCPCDICSEARGDGIYDEPNEMSDVEADANTLASAGFGTDEDYGYDGDGEDW